MPHLKRNHLFENEVSRATFKTFIKYGGFSTSETNISALIRFDAVMANAIDSLAEFVTSSETANKNGSQEADIQSSDELLR